MSGYPKYEIRTGTREDIQISEIRRISVISYSYPISELYHPNSNPKSENSADIRKKLSSQIISHFGLLDAWIIFVPFTPLLQILLVQFRVTSYLKFSRFQSSILQSYHGLAESIVESCLNQIYFSFFTTINT